MAAATKFRNKFQVRLLVKSRADPKVQDEKQMTPLHKAGGVVFRFSGGMKVGWIEGKSPL